jgi:hypothetical protein
MRYIQADKDSWFHLKPLARENRKNQTFAESIIWNALRNNN